MKQEIVIAGFGGQGVLSMGMTLAYGGMVENKDVSWMPSYGPEMRGGTANCTVILNDEKISSPIINSFDTAIILNQPSMAKFESKVKPGGQIIYESNNILTPPTRSDITILDIPANKEAVKLNIKRVMNMIILGTYLGLNPVLKIESILKALTKVLPGRHHHLIPINQQALERGMELATQPTIM
ncbi:MAG: 2-oxoacid:acceptor oxidoreductase family protein [Candidatus Marinimicrobia bacterium]|nr:2-oxoacid:acceptor oxidoreductase family protein [Candidatus Neomarinimicrobiota bacterium]MBL7010265.1 2-oxoacid:acceptor oxidoreductase family protein [Candidatus Neomarinimicrobiota bacterium]MBL7030213.1 2-oxoacid:acceptor oxidoreductase family protein [Candidatus Neomarinimicrobiota bacterium]